MIASGNRGGVVETGDLGLSLFIWSVIALGLSLGAFSPRARAQRAAELQERADRLEREREERTRAAVAAERARIARDLHDVIAHSVSVMTVQGGAARLLLDSDDRVAREPLLVVEETGRQAWPRCAACSASWTASRGAIRRSRPGPAWRSRPTSPQRVEVARRRAARRAKGWTPRGIRRTVTSPAAWRGAGGAAGRGTTTR
jgi:hypothetical protein